MGQLASYNLLKMLAIRSKNVNKKLRWWCVVWHHVSVRAYTAEMGHSVYKIACNTLPSAINCIFRPQRIVSFVKMPPPTMNTLSWLIVIHDGWSLHLILFHFTVTFSSWGLMLRLLQHKWTHCNENVHDYVCEWRYWFDSNFLTLTETSHTPQSESNSRKF